MISCDDVLMTLRYGKYSPIYDTILLDKNKENTLEDLRRKSEFYFNYRLEFIRFLDDDLVCVYKREINHSYGICDIYGNVILDIVYERIGNYFSEGLIDVFKNGKYSFVNRHGKEIIRCDYKDVRSFHEGLAAVQDKKSNLWGYINRKGKLVIDCQFISAFDFHLGLALVDDNKYIDKEGNIKLKMRDDCCYYDFYDNASVFSLKNLYSDDVLYGYVDISGREFIARQYDIAYPFYNGIALVGNKQYYGFYVGVDDRNYKINFYYIDKNNSRVVPNKKLDNEYKMFLHRNFDKIDYNNRGKVSLRGYKIENGNLIRIKDAQNITIWNDISYKKSIDDINWFYSGLEDNLPNAYNFISNEFIFLENYKIGTKMVLDGGKVVIDENTNPKESESIKILTRGIKNCKK